MPTTKAIAQPIDVVIGQRLKHLRTSAVPKPLTIEQFGAEMRARLGRGWYPAAVLKVESGQQPMRIAELAAAADVFHCTIADIVSSPTPVDLGGEGNAAVVSRLDAAMSGDESMPEAVVYAHFERAADALSEQRLAEDRYSHEIAIVRRALARDDAASAATRARIEAYQRRVFEMLRAELDEHRADDVEHARILGAEPPPPVLPIVPAIVAARDALDASLTPAKQWWHRRPTTRKEDR